MADVGGEPPRYVPIADALQVRPCCGDRLHCILEVQPMTSFLKENFVSSVLQHLSSQVEEGVTMWSFTCWREGEVERDPELRAGRALKELEGWPEEVRTYAEFRSCA